MTLRRASAYGNLGIMFPMITSLRELHDAKNILDECRVELAAEGKKMGEVEVGTMIETPAAVLVADDLAEECDFFSIGTNDLSQYTLAADRLSADLADLTDPWQPALLALVQATAAAGRRAGKPVGVCGEAAADPVLACVLVGMGISSLSCAASSVAGVGARLATVDLATCRRAAEVALAAARCSRRASPSTTSPSGADDPGPTAASTAARRPSASVPGSPATSSSSCPAPRATAWSGSRNSASSGKSEARATSTVPTTRTGVRVPSATTSPSSSNTGSPTSSTWLTGS